MGRKQAPEAVDQLRQHRDAIEIIEREWKIIAELGQLLDDDASPEQSQALFAAQVRPHLAAIVTAIGHARDVLARIREAHLIPEEIIAVWSGDLDDKERATSDLEERLACKVTSTAHLN